jgi:hypothetical protein
MGHTARRLEMTALVTPDVHFIFKGKIEKGATVWAEK